MTPWGIQYCSEKSRGAISCRPSCCDINEQEVQMLKNFGASINGLSVVFSTDVDFMNFLDKKIGQDLIGG